MTVEALIELLKTYSPDWQVWVDAGDYAASEGHLMVSPSGGWRDSEAVTGL